MTQAQVWTGMKLHPDALALLEGTATITISKVGERGDWQAEAAGYDVIMVRGSTFVTGEVMDRLGPRLR
ncbi:MAG: hypothetical protein J2P36_32485, partial [Ktedonobacteraceae bacterium]|nr:hypothetical protein [Ktedonobacteraceae bacterium]